MGVDECLPWHMAPWQQLWQRHAAGRLPHALLLAGPAGLGKGVFARRLIRALLCTQVDAEGKACGLCRGCRLVQVGSHPDMQVLQPEEDGKPIKIDAVRELCIFLGCTTQYGGYKIALLEPADRLNVNAANSLLKTLEEPPGNSLLLLVSDRPARLPATVRSRCQRIDFAPPPLASARDWLTPQIPAAIDPVVLLAITGGAPLAALAQADGARWARRRTLFEAYRQTLAGSADPVCVAQDWMQGDLSENLCWLIGWHHDLIRLKMMGDPPRLDNPDLRPVLQEWARQHALRTLFERLDAAMRLRAVYATTQVNVQMQLEAFLGGGARDDLP